MSSSSWLAEALGMLNLRNVYRARRVIEPYVRRTPLVYSRRLSRLLGFDVYLKLECLQVTRAFKVRGGVYYALTMREKALRHGLVTASTGNHAQSIAYAGSIIGARTVIVMPHGVPRNKVEAVRELGAEVVFYGRVFEEAREYAEKLAREKGMLYVHPVNEPLLYLGVATMHLENLEDLPDVDVVVNPIGGGSGASGAVIVFKSADPRVQVIGVQAEGAKSFYLSWKTGKLISTGRADTIAEGLATARAYELPLAVLRGRLDDIVLVTDEEIVHAVRTLFHLERIVAEPSGAAALAAAMKIRDRLKGLKVIVMVTGGNISDELLSKIVSGEAENTGRSKLY
jgi:threonine dehydratase